MAMAVIYALLAIVFKSYLQPMVVMSAIPFGIVGAIGGHLLMGFDLSMISMMGIVALSGIVVNDSLILVVEIQKHTDAGESDFEAAVKAGMRRFRPILLTSLTTFVGLMPMILETSVQARFFGTHGYQSWFWSPLCNAHHPCVYPCITPRTSRYRKFRFRNFSYLSPPLPSRSRCNRALCDRVKF